MRPLKITLYIWLTIALLGVVCLIAPENGWKIGDQTLRWPTIAQVLDPNSQSSALTDSTWIANLEDSTILVESTTICTSLTKSLTASDSSSVNYETTLVAAPDSFAILEEDRDIQIDPHYYLTAFYEALDSADVMQVRVVHYGDSQIEEDRITSSLREHWQAIYGGGGVGLLPLHQTIPTMSLRQSLSMNGGIQSTQGGPKRYLIYGPSSMRMKDNDYGVMGQVAALNNNLVSGSQNVIMKVSPYDKKIKNFNYFSQIRVVGENVKVSITQPVTEIKDSLVERTTIFTVPDSTTQCNIQFKGKGNVYGVSLETPTGVIVDNIPMRGCSGSIFTRIDSVMLSDFYRESNTRLIILQYGGNMIPQTKNRSTVRGYIETLRKQIHFLRSCAPYASILFIGPSDMSTRINGVMTTYPMVPYMDQLLAQMAAEEGIAYWSMYNAMGGHGSMVQWKKNGLAGSDYVHFTRTGAKKVGKMLCEWFDWEPQIEDSPVDTLQIDTPIVSTPETIQPTQLDSTQQ